MQHISSSAGLKICLVGNATVGKSCIAARFVKDSFNKDTVSTLGSAYMHKELQVDGQTCYLNIWDTAGQERFRALAPMYYRDAHAIILVFDITNEDSFTNVRTVWMPSLRACTKADVTLALVGNKLDLENNSRLITTEEARGYAEILGAVFKETSAKTGKNIEELFNEVVRKIILLKKPEADSLPKNVIRLPGSAVVQDTSSSSVRTDQHATSGGATNIEKPKSSCACN